MKISTKGTYAMRIMADIAVNQQQGNVAVNELATRQNISVKYLEQIMQMLVKAKLVSSHRGIAGGYTLSRPADKISVGDILAATEGKLQTVSCIDGKCEMAANCMTINVWGELDRIVNDFLTSTTLQDVITNNVK